MSGDVATLEADWDAAAVENVYYNILTDLSLSRKDFWDSGFTEIGELLERLPDVRRARALDFGCGIGRLSRALARNFRRVDGVDVSSEMIQRAEVWCEDHPGLRFHHNPAADLKLFRAGSFDLIYSMIVLQHMDPALARGYVREFIRVSRGLIVFQLPAHLPPPGGGDRWLWMYGTPREEVEGSWLAGTTIVDVEENQASGVDATSYLYIARVDR